MDYRTSERHPLWEIRFRHFFRRCGISFMNMTFKVTNIKDKNLKNAVLTTCEKQQS